MPMMKHHKSAQAGIADVVCHTALEPRDLVPYVIRASMTACRTHLQVHVLVPASCNDILHCLLATLWAAAHHVNDSAPLGEVLRVACHANAHWTPSVAIMFVWCNSG